MDWKHCPAEYAVAMVSGYTRIRGALANLGHQVGRGTIANILLEHSIGPAPERDRHTRGSTFIKAHRKCLMATDFLGVEVCTLKGFVDSSPITPCSSSTSPPDRCTSPASRLTLTIVDDADRAQGHRCQRGFSLQQAIPDSRPRCKVLG